MLILLEQDQRIENLLDKLCPFTDYDAAGVAKYGEPYLIAELIKRDLRIRYKRHLCRTSRVDWRAFWQEYEEVNRRWMPEDPVYSGTRGGVTVSTSADLWTLTSPGSGQVRVLESYVGGEATSTTVVRLAVQRSTGGTSATNQTPEKFNTRSPAASSTFATTWSSQPTLSGNALVVHAFNAFGGVDRWVPSPGEEIYLVNGELLSCRSAAGTPTVSSMAVWEEL